MHKIITILSALALVVLITGCAYNGDESGSSEPYQSPPHTGHQH